MTLTGGAHCAPSGFGGGVASGGFFAGTSCVNAIDLPSGDQAMASGGFDEIGQQRGLPGIHPAHVELRAALGGGHVCEARAVRRPARRAEAADLGAQRPVVSAVGVDHPQIAARAVGHDVVADAHVDDAVAVGRDLHVVGVFELEHVDGVQAPRRLRRSSAAPAQDSKQQRPRRARRANLGFIGNPRAEFARTLTERRNRGRGAALQLGAVACYRLVN